MTDPNMNGLPKSFQDIDSAMAALEQEQRRIADISKVRQEETTTVQSKDHSLEMTFDGTGELSDLKFNGTKYRSMPPAQLASVIVETLQKGRAQSMAKMTELMSNDLLPGVDLAGVASGKVDPSSVLDALMSPMLGDAADELKRDRSDKDERNG